MAEKFRHQLAPIEMSYLRLQRDIKPLSHDSLYSYDHSDRLRGLRADAMLNYTHLISLYAHRQAHNRQCFTLTCSLSYLHTSESAHIRICTHLKLRIKRWVQDGSCEGSVAVPVGSKGLCHLELRGFSHLHEPTAAFY